MSATNSSGMATAVDAPAGGVALAERDAEPEPVGTGSELGLPEPAPTESNPPDGEPDDVVPELASEGARSGPPHTRSEHVRSVRFKTRRWGRTLSVLVLAAIVVGAGAFGGLYVYAQRVWQAIPKVSSDDLELEEETPGEPVTFMIVGSDNREDLPEELQGMVGSGPDFGGQRADTILIAHVDPTERRSFVLSVPRDLRVEVSKGGYDKINAAYNTGPQELVDSVEGFTGLEINHYAELDFESFRQIVDALGGIEYCFEHDVRDTVIRYTWDAGCRTLNGTEALWIVRSRHFQERINGRWVGDGKGDLGRIERQQEFIMKLLAKISGAGAIPNVNRYAQIAQDHLVIDEAFDLGTAIDLFKSMTPVTPDRVEFVTLPVIDTMRGGVAYLELTEEAGPVLARLRGDAGSDQLLPGASVAVAPSEVAARIENGTTRGGLAGATANALRDQGFSVVSIVDADAKNHTETKIVYAPGGADKAELLKETLGVGVLSVGETGDADVIIVLGSDAPDPAALASQGFAPGPAVN